MVQEGGSRRHDHETRYSSLGHLFDLRYGRLIPSRFIFFTRHLAGLNHSGLDTKLRQNNCLKQKPDDHHRNYQQQPFHSTIPRLYFKFSTIDNINIPVRKSNARDDAASYIIKSNHSSADIPERRGKGDAENLRGRSAHLTQIRGTMRIPHFRRSL